MRILFLSAWCPLPADNGSKLRITHLLRELARQHEIDLLSFAPEPPGDKALRALNNMCASVELLPETPFAAHSGRLRDLLSPRPRSVAANYNSRMVAAVRQRNTQRYDLVIASQMHMAPYAMLIQHTPRVLEELEIATLYEQFHSAQQLRARLRYGLTWWKTRRYVAGLLRQFDGATVVSERELELVQPLAPSRVRLAVVPNGVDVAACSRDFGPPESDTLIYPGALSYDANFDAMDYFLGAILPQVRATRPDAQLRITGRATPAQVAALPRAEGVEFTGYLDDVRPAVARAWAEVVPLRKGGGTRLKVLEALALGTPLISTSKGIEGLALEHGRHVLVADTPAEFAAATARLLDQPDLRARMAAAGRQLAGERYDWQLSGQRLNELIADCGTA